MNNGGKSKEWFRQELGAIRQQIVELESKGRVSNLTPHEEAYRALVENSLQGLAILQRDRIVFVNSALANIFGYTKEELLNMPASDINYKVVHPEDRKIFLERFYARQENKPVSPRYECRIIRPDGTVRWLENFVTIIEYQGASAVQSTVIDITERRQAEAALRESEERYRSLFESMNEGIIASDQEDKIIAVNPAAAKMFGYEDTHEMIGFPASYLHAIPTERERVLNSLKVGHSATDVEWMMRKKNGSNFYIRCSITLQKDEKDEVVGPIVFFNDITDQKRAEKALWESEQLYKTIAREFPNGTISILDERFTYLFIDGTGLQEAGLTSSDFIGKRVTDIFTPSVAAIIQSFLQKSFRGESVVFEMPFKGVEYLVSAVPLYGDQNQIVKILMVSQNITVQKQAQKEIEQREAYLITLVEIQKKLLALHEEFPYSQILSLLGEVSRASRVSVFVTQEYQGDSQVKLKEEWVAEGLEMGEVDGFPQNELFPRWQETLAKGGILKGLVSEFPASEQKILETRGTLSILIIPLFVKGKFFGFIGFDNCIEARLWTAAETALLESAVMAIATAKERLLVERALQESNQRFATVMNNLEAMVYVSDFETYELLFVNDYTKRVFGDLVGKICWQTLRTDQSGPCGFCDRQRLMIEKDHSSEVSRWEVRNNVTGRWYYIQDQTIHWTDGRLVRLEIATDITDRKQTEEALIASEEKYRNIFNATKDALFVLDVETEAVLDVNPAACEMYGYSYEEMLKLKATDFTTQKEKCAMILRGSEERVPERLHCKKDGSTFFVEISLSYFEQQGRRLVACANRDIIERKQSEEALRAIKQRYELAVDVGRTGVWDWDIKQGTFYIDPRIKKLLGYQDDEIPNRVDVWTEHVHPEDKIKVMKALREYLSGSRSRYEIAHRVLHKDGSIRWILTRGTAMYNEENKVYRVIGTNTDITERMEISAQLQQRNLELALINRISQEFISILDLDQILKHLLSEVRQLLEVTGCSVWLLSPDSSELICEQAVSPHSEIVQGWRLESGQGIAGWVVEHGESQIVPDVRYDDRHFAQITQTVGLKIRSLVTVPLWGSPLSSSTQSSLISKVNKKRIIGVLQVMDIAKDRFTDLDLRLLEPLAVTAAIAIENARLYAQTRQDADTKALLLCEVNHRVKNNLAAILGLLYAEQNNPGMKDYPLFRKIIKKLINRVQGLDTVHNMLSASQWSPLFLSDLARRIINSALDMLPLDKWASVEVADSDSQVTAKQAHNLALIINELTTNSVKYALEEGQEILKITVQISSKNDQIRFKFCDNGGGYPEEMLHLNLSSSDQVGFRFIQNMVRHLQGNLSLHNDGGAVTIIEFKALA